ncbi:phage portal protein [Ruminiclostridium papyrosolvens]|uniref:Phage portal protein n=1 Tax=Ruminiclostridium papyrosolvens C7 TaxID=1330534 RepID=U4QXD4_9FIRM|nr:phage portal protein [Ruminiclostridium papyrosolvens]EPR07660.1 phage portal protein [Ruminiclostridium papyrosolvens C7]
MKLKNPFRRNKTRADPVMLWLNGTDARDILCPEGYTPLSKNEEIRRCVFKIADLVSNMTIMLMENGENGDIRLKNELSKKIDIYPNNNMTRKNFIHKLVTDMILTGNAVAYPQIKNGLIDNLKILNADSLNFDEVGDSYQIRYRGTPYYPDEVLHFVLNPDDDYPFKGQGYTQLIKETVMNLLQANATKKGFLKSKWKPSMIISINSDAEELQDPEKRAKILGSYTKTTEIGEPWLIPAGEIDVKTIQPLTLNDLAIQDSITLDLKVIAAAIGVPGFMVGVGAFNKEEYNNFISTTIMSIAMILQQELSKKLLFSPTMYFKFNPKSLMQYDLGEKDEHVVKMVTTGMLSKNEGRAEFDYSPVDVDGMNDYTVLENYLKVSDLSKQKKLEQGGGNGG